MYQVNSGKAVQTKNNIGSCKSNNFNNNTKLVICVYLISCM